MKVKTIKKVIVLFAMVICILLLKQTDSYAMTQEEAGTYIASYATNFTKEHGPETVYSLINSDRKMAYNLQKVEGYYRMDCVGFVNLVLHQSIGLDIPITASGDGGFVVPFGDSWGYDNQNGNFFNDLGQCTPSDIGAFMPGDIIANGRHVMIYIGNGQVAHCAGWGDGVTINSFEEVYNHYYYDKGYQEHRYYRIKADVAEGLSEGNSGGGLIDKIENIAGSIWDKITSFVGILSDENDDDYTKGPPISDEEYNKLYYKGLANEVGKHDEEVKNDSILDFTFPKLSTIVDYIVGSMIYPVRASVVGWTNIVQIEVSNYIQVASGEKDSIKTDDGILTNLKQKMEDSLTLEKIVYNKVPVLDVNIFNLTKAGGKDVKESSLTGIIRELVSNWYYIFRTITIIALLIILIYIGVKIAITSIAEEKATYKEALKNWLVAFIIVFAMPYIMILIMQINESLVSMFAGLGKDLNLYETVREMTWSIKMSVGVIATILYVTLVYYLVKFIILYLKRLFVTIVLIIIAPLVAGKYAYDKIRGGKGDNSLSKWLQEYTFSVMMQTVHALVYTVFISMTINISASAQEGPILATLILSLIFFNFMTKSEKIVRGVMSLKGGNKAVSFGDADSTKLHDLIGWSYLRRTTGFNGSMKTLKPMYKFSKDYLSKKINDKNTTIGKIAKMPEDIYVEGQKEKLKKKYGTTKLYEMYNNVGGNGMSLDKKIDYAIRENYHMNIGAIESLGVTSVKIATGMGKSMIAIPLFVAESPLLGVETFFSGISTLAYAAGKPIKGYKQLGSTRFTSNSKVYKTMETLSTGGMNKVIRNMIDVYGQKIDILKNYKPEQIRLLYQSKMEMDGLAQELEKLKSSEFKGYQDGSSELERKLAEEYQVKLEQYIEESQKTIEKSEIKEKIKEYENEKQNYSLGTKDLNKIAKGLQKVDTENPKNNIIIKKEVEDNIKQQVSTGMLHNIMGIKDEYKNLQVDDSSVDAMIEKVKDRINEMNESGKPEDSKEQTAARISLDLLEQRKGNNSEEKVDIKQLSEEEKNDVKEVLQDAITEEDMDKTTQMMSLDDLAQLMKISVDTKGSIEKAPVPIKFGGVIEKAENLRNINEKMKEMTNKNIDDKGNIINKQPEKIYETQELKDIANRIIRSKNISVKNGGEENDL